MKKILLAAMFFVFLIKSGVFAGYVEPLPSMTVLEALGINSINEIKGGHIMSLDSKRAVDLTSEQIRRFYDGVGNTTVERRVVKHPFSGMAVVFSTDEGEKTYYINSGVQVGKYGQDNFLCYVPSNSNYVINELYAFYMSTDIKYDRSVFTINDQTDYLALPNEQWAIDEVIYGASKSLVSYEITRSLGKAISREELCILVANYLCVTGNYYTLEGYLSQRGITYSHNYFSDTLEFDKNINMLYALGVVNGKGQAIFAPTDAVTREEAAAVLKNAATAAGLVLKIADAGFVDSSHISPWASESVNAMGVCGVMSGINGEFKPKDFLTTEQAIAAINKLFRLTTN